MTYAEDELQAHRPSEEFTNAVIRLATSENDRCQWMVSCAVVSVLHPSNGSITPCADV